MNSPHESLALNPRRGLLAAVLGNPSTYPGLVSIYDVQPGLPQAGAAVDPAGRAPRPRERLLRGRQDLLRHRHGRQRDLGDRRDRPQGPALDLAGQHRLPRHVAQPRRQPRLPRRHRRRSCSSSTPARSRRARPTRRRGRSAASPGAPPRSPRTRSRSPCRGKPYLLETDEYTQGTTGGGQRDEVGAARIIDISDERRPEGRRPTCASRSTSPPTTRRRADDPGAISPVQGYAAHYCDVSTPKDPKVVACSFIASGLRVFDISDLTKPKEIAYYVPPAGARVENGCDGSNYAMSKPAVVPSRREVWFTDGGSGFYNLRVKDARVARRRAAAAAWRAGRRSGRATSAACGSASRARSSCAACPRRAGAPSAPGAGA